VDTSEYYNDLLKNNIIPEAFSQCDGEAGGTPVSHLLKRSRRMGYDIQAALFSSGIGKLYRSLSEKAVYSQQPIEQFQRYQLHQV
jgi:hypothetical protein